MKLTYIQGSRKRSFFIACYKDGRKGWSCLIVKTTVTNTNFVTYSGTALAPAGNHKQTTPIQNKFRI